MVGNWKRGPIVGEVMDEIESLILFEAVPWVTADPPYTAGDMAHRAAVRIRLFLDGKDAYDGATIREAMRK